MKKEKLIESVMKGIPLVVAEYRNREAEDRGWKDRDTGAQMHSTFCHDNIEVNGRPIKLGVRFDGDVAKDDPRRNPLFKPGTAVVLKLESLSQEKGNFKATGSLEILD